MTNTNTSFIRIRWKNTKYKKKKKKKHKHNTRLLFQDQHHKQNARRATPEHKTSPHCTGTDRACTSSSRHLAPVLLGGSLNILPDVPLLRGRHGMQTAKPLSCLCYVRTRVRVSILILDFAVQRNKKYRFKHELLVRGMWYANSGDHGLPRVCMLCLCSSSRCTCNQKQNGIPERKPGAWRRAHSGKIS